MRVYSGGGAGGSTPLSAIFVGGNNGAGVAVTANKLVIAGFILSVAVKIGNLDLDIALPDGGNNCDVGIYNSTGALVGNIGAQTIGAGQYQTFALVQGSISLSAGNYIFAYTSAASNFQLFSGHPVFWHWCVNLAFGASAGGALPASITPPAYSPTHSSFSPDFGMH